MSQTESENMFFLCIPTKKNICILEDAIVFFGRTWMKQVATLTLRP